MGQVDRERFFANSSRSLAREFRASGIIDSSPQPGLISLLVGQLSTFEGQKLGVVVAAVADRDLSYLNPNKLRLALFDAAEREASQLRTEIARSRVSPNGRGHLDKTQLAVMTRTLRGICDFQDKLLEEVEPGLKVSF